MALFGRGQPHAPILLRGAAAAVVAASSTLLPIHVVSLPRAARPVSSHVVVLHGARALVPDRLAPQIHVLGAPRPPRRFASRTVVLHGLPSQVPPRLAPQLQVEAARSGLARRARVILLRPQATAVAAPAAKAAPALVILARSHPPTPGHYALLRPSRASLVPDRLAPQIHVTPLLPRAARRAAILLARTPAAPAVVAARATEPTIVLSPRGLRVIRRAAIVVLRTPATPPKGSKPIAVLSVRVRRAGGHVLLLRGTSIVPARLAPQLHILLQRCLFRRGDVLLVRGVGPVAIVPLRLTYWQEINADSLAIDIGTAAPSDVAIWTTPIATIAVFTTDLA